MKLLALNDLSETEAEAALFKVCGSKKWARMMAELRPFATEGELFSHADKEWDRLGKDDWLEAFSHHPRIGASDVRSKWARQEQGGVAGASEETIKALAEGNAAYEAKFGHVFLVCATGKSAADMLRILNGRMGNAPEAELRVAAEEQAKIMRIRLRKLLDEK